MTDGVSCLESEVNRSLRLGVNRACSFSVIFRTDVFRFLFDGKGRDCPHKLGRFYDELDFSEEYFPPGWYECSDKLGDSCRIRFPVRMYSKVQWLPVVYAKDADGAVTPKKRSFK